MRTGGSLAVSDARITGAVTADGALVLTVCRSTPTGPLTVRHGSGYVRLAGDATTCAGNGIRGR